MSHSAVSVYWRTARKDKELGVSSSPVVLCVYKKCLCDGYYGFHVLFCNCHSLWCSYLHFCPLFPWPKKWLLLFLLPWDLETDCESECAFANIEPISMGRNWKETDSNESGFRRHETQISWELKLFLAYFKFKRRKMKLMWKLSSKCVPYTRQFWTVFLCLKDTCSIISLQTH